MTLICPLRKHGLIWRVGGLVGQNPRNAGISPSPPPPALWDTDACARPVLFSTKQECKAKVEERGSSVTCHRRLSLYQTKMAWGPQVFTAGGRGGMGMGMPKPFGH